MKNLAVLSVIAILLACGGAPQTEAPVPEEIVVAPPVQGTVAASDGVQIAYTIRGGGSPALVFIHGWMCNQSFWEAQAQPMSESNTVVTLDLPGHGLSGMDRKGWPLMAFGSDVKAVVEHLDLQDVILIGHSMGGPVALEAARLMPDRVIGVIGVDTLQDADASYDPAQAEAILAQFNADFVATCNQFVASMFLEDADPVVAERVQTDMCNGSPEVGTALMTQFMDYELAAALAAVSVPVRCVNAGLWPTNVEGNRVYNEDFDAVIIDGTGHFLMMEMPEQFNAHLALAVAELSEPF